MTSKTETPNVKTAASSTLVFTALLFVAPLSQAAAETARGRVFEDLNRNGQCDSGEPGVAGAAVSNQEDVVLTDADGHYELPVTNDTIIFVSKPAGYTLPLDGHNLPQFYYIHKPTGSPHVYYGGVKPTGPLPDSIDFPLIRNAASDEFEVIVMADPQPETSQEVGYIRDDVASELVGCEAAFGVTLGDIAGNHLDLYGGYNDVMGRIGIPIYNVIGNHDTNYDAPDDQNSDETFHRFFGPNYYSWNEGRVHFVALDSVEWMGDAKGHGNYRGSITDRQLRWLKNDLDHVPDDRLLVLLMHIPIVISEGHAWVNKDKFFDLLASRKNILALAGHMHYQQHEFFGSDQGWNNPGDFHQLIVGAVCGSWWSGPKDVRGIPVSDNRDGVPNGYAVVRFDGNDYTTRFKAAGFDAGRQMSIYPPGSISDDDAGRHRIIVNVFNGSARTRVEYSLDGGDYREMKNAPQPDPLSLVIIAGVVDSGKPWARPVASPHIWSADLANPIPRGTHVITVRATDERGHVDQESRIFSR